MSSLSLPPGVGGPLRGQLACTLEAAEWAGARPAHCQLRVRFWGAAQDVVLPAEPGAACRVPVHCGAAHFRRYCTDMGTLELAVEDCATASTVGAAAVDVSALEEAREVAGEFPVLSAAGKCLGQLRVALRVSFEHSVTASFERAEQRAETDTSLPTFPAAVVQQVTRLDGEAGSEVLAVEALFEASEARLKAGGGARKSGETSHYARFDLFLLLDLAIKR